MRDSVSHFPPPNPHRCSTVRQLVKRSLKFNTWIVLISRSVIPHTGSAECCPEERVLRFSNTHTHTRLRPILKHDAARIYLGNSEDGGYSDISAGGKTFLENSSSSRNICTTSLTVMFSWTSGRGARLDRSSKSTCSSPNLY